MKIIADLLTVNHGAPVVDLLVLAVVAALAGIALALFVYKLCRDIATVVRRTVRFTARYIRRVVRLAVLRGVIRAGHGYTAQRLGLDQCGRAVYGHHA